ncbi:MAG: hypothetical protein ABIJ21_08520 [Nanoarchaeota archaeon]
MITREKIISYFTHRGVDISIQDHTITAEFPGDISLTQTHIRGALEAAAGEPARIQSTYYQEVVNKIDKFGYRQGDEVPWQHVTRIYNMPVIIHHHSQGMRPEAVPNEQNPAIANSAELILPGIGPVMSGIEITANGKRTSRITISLNGLDSYLRS